MAVDWMSHILLLLPNEEAVGLILDFLAHFRYHRKSFILTLQHRTTKVTFAFSWYHIMETMAIV